MTNEAINTLKNTSLLSTITIVEVTMFAQLSLAETFRPFDFLIAAALIYLVMTTLLSSSPLGTSGDTPWCSDQVEPRGSPDLRRL